MGDEDSSRRSKGVVFWSLVALFAAGFLFAGVGTVAGAEGCTPVNGSTVIDQPGCYELAEDVSDSPNSTFVKIRANDVIFDGMGHTIDGSRSSGSYGIFVNATSSNVTVRNVTVTDWAAGIRVHGASGVTIESVTGTSPRDEVVHVTSSSHVEVVDLEVYDISSSTDDAVIFENVHDSRIVDSSFHGNAGEVVTVTEGTNVTIARNSFDDSGEDSITFRDTSASTIRDNVFTNGSYHAISLLRDSLSVGSSSNLVANNTISGTDGRAVSITDSSSNVVRNNTMTNNDHGVYVRSYYVVTSNNHIGDNVIDGTDYSGITLDGGSAVRYNDVYRPIRHVAIENNTITSATRRGVVFYSAYNATMRDTHVSGAETNFVISEWAPENDDDHDVGHFYHDVDTSNTVDGKPIYYLHDVADLVIDASWDPGFIGIVNGHNVTVRDLTVTNVGHGVLFVGTDDSMVQNVTATEVSHGIFLSDNSVGNTLIENTIVANATAYQLWHSGIRLADAHGTYVADNLVYDTAYGLTLAKGSTDSVIERNTIRDNSIFGVIVRFGDIHNHTIADNTLHNNDDGIYFFGADTSGFLITNNTVTKSRDRHGILLSGDGHMISGNFLQNNGGYSADNAIFGGGTNHTIVDNVVLDTHGIGITVGSTSLVENNTIVNSTRGIRLAGDDSVVTDNVVDGAWSHGIYLDEITYRNVVDGNTVTNVSGSSTSAAIYFNYRARDSFVTNNTLTSNDRGIFVHRTVDAVLDGNVVTDSSEWGVHTQQDATNTTATAFVLDDKELDFAGTNFQIDRIVQPYCDPVGTRNVGIFFDVSFTDEGTYDPGWLNFTVHYTDDDVAGVDESTLALYRYDGLWTEVTNATIDTAANTIAVNVSTPGVLVPVVDGTPICETIDPSSTWSEYGFDASNTGHLINGTGPNGNLAEVWNRSFDSTVYGPTVIGDRVLVAAGETLYALNASTNEVVWTGSPSSLDGFRERPVYHDGIVYGFTYDYRDRYVVAYRFSDGGELWRFSYYDSSSFSGFQPATVHDGTLYLASRSDDRLFALDARTGAERWNYTTGGSAGSHVTGPAVDGGYVFIADDTGTVRILDETSGNEVASIVATDDIPHLVVRDGTLYVVETEYSGGYTTTVTAYDIAATVVAGSGVDTWNRTVGTDTQGEDVALADDTLFVGTDDGNVTALDVSTGSTRWTATESAGLYSIQGLSIADDVVYFSSRADDAVMTLDASTGDHLWSYTMEWNEVESIAIADCTMYLVPAYNDELHVVSGDACGGGEPVNAPDITVSPASYDFGDVTVGHNTTVNVTVANEGNADLDVTGAALSGDITQFSIVSGGAPFTLSSGESRDVTVEFGPDAEGSFAAILEISSNDSDIDVTLSGSGVADAPSPPNFSVSVLSTNSPVEEGEILRVTASVVNVGDETGTQTVALDLDGSDVDTRSVTLDGGDSTTVTLSHTTSSADVGQHAATVSSDNSSDSQTVEVTAASGDPDIDLLTTSLDFGYVPLGDNKRLNVTVSNVGTAPLAVDTIDVVGVNHLDFRLPNDDSFSLAPDESRNVTVEFDPQASGDKLARLDLYSNDPDESSVSVSLSGTTVPGDITVDGQIRTAGGSPAVNDTVALLNQGTLSMVASATTDGTGNFSIEAPEGVTYTVAYVQWDDAGNLGPVDGTPDVFALTTVSGNATVTRTLPTAYETNITVVRADTGAPVNDSMVEFSHVDGPARLPITGSTDDQGRFVLSNRENPGIEAVGVLELYVYSPLGSDLDSNATSVTVDGRTDAIVVLQAPDDDEDSDGSDNVTVNSITVANGTDPGPIPYVEAWVDEQPMLQLSLRTAEHGDYDLESLGFDHTTEFEIELTVEDFTPRLLLGAGNVTSWERSPNGTNATDVTIRVQPIATQAIFECEPDGQGGELCTTPDLSDWPTGANDTATDAENVTVSMAIGDLGGYSTEQRNALDGAVIATDAQLFGDPVYQLPADGQPATLSLLVGAPHYTVDGEENTGFYQAFLPDALLAEWNVTNPGQLTAAYQGSQASFTATNVSGGIVIDLDLHYSAGDVVISSDTASNDNSSGTDPTPTPTPTPTATPTPTTTPTLTPTPKPTVTPTATPTTTPTATPTSSPTPTPTPTQTHTPTATSTDTPTSTPSSVPDEPKTIALDGGQPGFGFLVAVLAMVVTIAARLRTVNRDR